MGSFVCLFKHLMNQFLRTVFSVSRVVMNVRKSKGYLMLLMSLFSFPFSEFSGDVDSLELGDMVEYSLSKGKGNKVSAEKVNKTHSGNEL